MRCKPTPFLVRLEAVQGEPDACWIWPTSAASRGYCRVYWQGRYQQAHRAAYEHLRGPIADGLVLDHLCRVRACVNPNHLEPVTAGENVLRGIGKTARQKRQTHCRRGHELAGDNLYLNPKRGFRHCRACQIIANREREARDPEAAKAARARSWQLYRARHDPVFRKRISANHCFRGHELTPENTGPRRGCRICRNARTREWNRERRALRKAE